VSVVIEIGWPQLALCLLFILAAGLASMALRLGLQRDLLWGTVRTVTQLFMLGLILKYVFNFQIWWPVLLIFWCMLAFSVQIIHGRVREKSIPYLDTTFLSMFLSFTLITMIVTALIVQVRPWYEPRYFLPLGGMVIGNSMNAIAIALERLFGELHKSKNLVEMRLTLGASYREATADITRGAVKAGMIPSINAMMGAGMVFIPGMMTGQILAGADVVTAVKYQIIVMMMLVGSTSVGSVIVVLLSLRRCFTRDGRLRV
jgi:putative ABC transport system permease protein